MNAESFAEYLKNPSRLYQINYQELKSLALQYPYCQNLQWLLLYKSGIDHHRDFDANLEKTAASSLDRTLLFRQMQDVIEQEKPMALLNFEETLDLQEVPNLQFQPKPLEREQPSEEPPAPKSEALPFEPPITSAPEAATEELEMNLPAEPEAQAEEEAPAPEEQIQNELIAAEAPEPEASIVDETEVTIEDAEAAEVPTVVEAATTPTEETPDATPAPTPKKTFDSWHTYQPPTITIKSKTKKTEVPLKHTEEMVAKIAQQSLLEQDEVISETLAAILARQGQKEKAIKMYERLILQFPKKSAFFAAQINKLKSS